MYQSLTHILHGCITIVGEDGTTALLSNTSHYKILLSAANSFLPDFNHSGMIGIDWSLERFQLRCFGVSKRFGENMLLFVD